jgi:hypothetical protein
MTPAKDQGRPAKPASAESGPGEYSLSGKAVRCPHCGGSQFRAGEAQLNTAWATLLGLDWADRSATVLICTTCSQIQWFGEAPSRVPR